MGVEGRGDFKSFIYDAVKLKTLRPFNWQRAFLKARAVHTQVHFPAAEARFSDHATHSMLQTMLKLCHLLKFKSGAWGGGFDIIFLSLKITGITKYSTNY